MHFEFHGVEIFQGISLPETAHFVFCNSLVIWHGLSDNTHINPYIACEL